MRGLDRGLPDSAAFLALLPRARRCAPGDARPGEVVLISGTAEPGPDGPLAGPASGLPCVWFRVLDVATAGWSSSSRPSVPPSLSSDSAFGGGYLIPRRDDESSARFRIGDGAGSVEVDPALIDLQTDVVPVDADGGTYEHGYTHVREWIVPPGTPLFACGVVDTDGVLRARPGAPLTVSTRGEQLAVTRAQTLARAGVGPQYLRQATSRGTSVVAAIVAGVVVLAVVVGVLVAVLA